MEADYDGLIDRIYEAALLPELWPSVIERLAERCGCVGGAIFSVANYKTAWQASASCRDHMQDLAQPRWMNLNIRAQRVIASDYMGFVTDHDLCSEHEIASAEIYVDFLRPRGLGWVVGSKIPAANGDLFLFSLDRPFERGPIPAGAVDLLDSLRPHIARSALLAGHLQMERMRGSVAGLNALGIPAGVVGPQGKLLLANASFEALDQRITIRAFDRITVADAEADAALRDALACIGSEAEPTPRSIPVRATVEYEPLVLHLVPVRRQANDLFGRAAALVMIVPLVRRNMSTRSLVKSLYDLTPAEARVAAELIEGRSVRDIAARQKVGQNTVRGQIKQVLAKTGTRRQADLVAKLAALSAFSPPLA